MLPTKIEALPSVSSRVAKSTGDVVIQLCDTGKLNSMPKAAHEPRYAMLENFIDVLA